MSGQFQYFVVPKVAGKPTIALDECAEYGLGHAFNSTHPPKCCKSSEGPRPDRSGGIILSSTTDRIGYYPNRQRWRAMHGNPDVWIGMETAHVPTPADLSHEKQADGEWLTMRDGSNWLIPRARLHELNEQGTLTYLETLPASLDVNASGQWIRGDVYSEYRRLWELANAFADGDRNCLDELANAAIAANYRAGQNELAMLRLLDTEWQVLKSIIDIVMDDKRGAELLKKTAGLTDGTSNGSAGALQSTTEERQDTDQPSQSREHGPQVSTSNLVEV